MDKLKQYRTPILCAALAAIIYAVDSLITLGMAVGICYIAVVWLAARESNPRHLIGTALACSLLIVAGAFLSPDHGAALQAVANRALSVGALCLSTIMVLSLQKSTALQARLASIIESTEDAITAMDTNGVVTHWNKGAEKLYGYNAREVIGTKAEFLLPMDLQHERDFIAEKVHACGSLSNFETERLHKNGSRVPVSMTTSLIRNARDVVMGVSTLTRDISAQREMMQYQDELNNSLQSANEALTQSNMELQQFAYVASHDLQAPLRRIGSFAKILEAGCSAGLDDAGKQWLNRIVDGVREMQNLIDDLLSFSRVDSESRPHGPVNLNEIFANVCSLQDERISSSNAKVTADDLPTVIADRTQMFQLLDNLVSNGLKYNVSDIPTIHVSAQCCAQQVVLSIKDNGIGIAQEHQEQIFEIFQRLHSSQDYAGSGIGLAICRRIAVKHGGSLWLESEPGKGSVFYCSIPQTIDAPLISDGADAEPAIL